MNPQNIKKKILDIILEITSLISDSINIIFGYAYNEPKIEGIFEKCMSKDLNLRHPYGIVTDDKYIYINDSLDFQVKVIDMDGLLVNCWGGFG